MSDTFHDPQLGEITVNPNEPPKPVEITWIYFNRQTARVVSDAGRPLEARMSTGETFMIPRYAVWSCRGSQGHEVTHTTDDLEEAKALCDRRDDAEKT
jgi:hypothetical protein